MAMSSVREALVVAVLASSCTRTAELPAVRFVNAPAATSVDDRRNVAQRPQRSAAYLDLDYYDRSFAGPILRGLSLPQHRRARGVNALDDVPDSTWFTNRIGVRDLTPEEVGRGPIDDDGPEANKPWTVLSTKPGGTEIGFVIRDASGTKYGISFDSPAWPELETGTAIIVNRLLYAFGYNVPADRIAYVRPDELVVASGAVTKDGLGNTTGQLDRAELLRRLANVARERDGRIRVLASRWVDGESLGGSSPTGVRSGDPNDRIPHEDRRDLRGQYPLYAWVEHVDLVTGNFLDVWTASPAEPARRYVVHYKLDFGKSLGTIAATDSYVRAGRAYLFDWHDSGRSIITLGLEQREWGHEFAPKLTGVAPTFVASGFDPGAWRPAIQYAPFDAADRFDMFWGAKLVGRFTRAQIRAAVDAAQFSDPRAAEYLTQTLLARQRATLDYWYGRVNPLDRFAMAGSGLCFDDLAVGAQLAPATRTRYDFASYDRAGRALGHAAIGAAADGHNCASTLPLADTGDGYTIVKVTTSRPKFTGSTLVHVAREPASGAWRVIGVWRL